jgi:hypothetical protein
MQKDKEAQREYEEIEREKERDIMRDMPFALLLWCVYM